MSPCAAIDPCYSRLLIVRSKTNKCWWRCFAESHSPSYARRTKSNKISTFRSSAIGIERKLLEPRTKLNEIELYGTKSNAHGFDIYTNKKVIFSCLEIENQGRKLSGGRGNWKLVPPPPKKIFAQGKLNGKKKSCTTINPKKYLF